MTPLALTEQACQQQAAVDSAADGEAAGRGGVVAAAYEHPFGPWRRRYTVALVSVIAALLCADQNLLAPNLSAAAAYFGLNEHQKDTILGGYLMAAFFLVGAPAALLCGYLADKHNRVLLLAAIIIIGEAPCLCTYWVTRLWQFFVLRMLTGVAVGGCFPLVFSLLGDLFPVSQRSAMAALVQIAVGAGIGGGQIAVGAGIGGGQIAVGAGVGGGQIAVGAGIGGGQLLAGLVGPATNWRVPFVVLAAPSLLLALLLMATVQEPPRGAFEEALRGQLAAGAAYSESISWRKVRRLLAIPSNWIIILQGLPGCLPWGGLPGCLPWGVMQTYINDYLHLNKGYSVEKATVVILLFGLGGGVGVLAGGAAGQLLYNWRKESMAVLTGLSVLAGVGPVYFLVNADLQLPATASGAFAGATSSLLSITGPNLRAIMININTPETRGVALALQSVTDDLGRGLGPVIVAGFINEEQMQQRLTKTAGAALQQIQVMQSGGTMGGEAGEPLSVHAGSSNGSSSVAAAGVWNEGRARLLQGSDPAATTVSRQPHPERDGSQQLLLEGGGSGGCGSADLGMHGSGGGFGGGGADAGVQGSRDGKGESPAWQEWRQRRRRQGRLWGCSLEKHAIVAAVEGAAAGEAVAGVGSAGAVAAAEAAGEAAGRQAGRAGWTLVDVRLASDFDAMSNSTWDNIKKLAMASFAMKATERDPDFVDTFCQTVKKNSKVLLMCAVDPERAFGRESRSLKAIYELYDAGWSLSNIRHVEGGFQEWKYQGLPLAGDEE
ncbi:major facilitator superfamily domain-containing protein [Scenedesmus sp. NREL 46B-D3]|nr:major facilitator superfamily domain-containing protein [Scenedesmus sp. NREL 46B-D3]